MVDTEKKMFHDYFCTVGSGMETFTANELLDLGSSYIQDIIVGKVFFSSSLSVKALLSLKTAERLFILVHKESQFLLSHPRRDALKMFCALVEGNNVLNWSQCLEKWKEFNKYTNKGVNNINKQLRFRVSCKCSGKMKHAFSPAFLGKIFAGSLLNIHTQWIPELRRPQLEVLINASMDMLTIGLACCPFNEPLSKRSYLPSISINSILRPTLCSAMLSTALKTCQSNSHSYVRTLEKSHGMENEIRKHNPIIILDPMCGTGILLAEAALYRNIENVMLLLGSDSDSNQLKEAQSNIASAENMLKNISFEHLEKTTRKSCYSSLFMADARALPLSDNSVDFIVSDIPFGLKHSCKPWPRQERELIKTVVASDEDSTHSKTTESEPNDTREGTLIYRKKSGDDMEEDKAILTVKLEMDNNRGSFQAAINSGNVSGPTASFPDQSSIRLRGMKRKKPAAKEDSDVIPSKVNAFVETSTIEDVRNMLPQIVAEMDRVLVSGGRVSLLISETLRLSLLEAINSVTSSNTYARQLKIEQDISTGIRNEVLSYSFGCHSSSTLNSQFDEPNEETVLEETTLDDKQQPKKTRWLCCEQHKVKLGVLDAVICVFSKVY